MVHSTEYVQASHATLARLQACPVLWSATYAVPSMSLVVLSVCFAVMSPRRQPIHTWRHIQAD
ncbi:hypothetical protein LX32DRAFT_641567 [Colletotrichum zoysiae]|uniref:Uncharacterized protein n=1 Tax=Colletotrichum zoysiae TaxID=1216348 RepID=A0AAD9LZK6_9PEZI|nr:hypothetical protein LX32DRAFT_641567 [Colletotrichum zoysiae]